MILKPGLMHPRIEPPKLPIKEALKQIVVLEQETLLGQFLGKEYLQHEVKSFTRKEETLEHIRANPEKIKLVIVKHRSALRILEEAKKHNIPTIVGSTNIQHLARAQNAGAEGLTSDLYNIPIIERMIKEFLQES